MKMSYPEKIKSIEATKEEKWKRNERKAGRRRKRVMEEPVKK
jgi:hypothetical protein